MITYSELGRNGRLGNQLFQYAILLAISSKRGYEVRIPNLESRIWHGQKSLLPNFNISAKIIKDVQLLNKFNQPQKFNNLYNPNVFNISDNTDLFGFFHNSKYFEHCEDLIIGELTPKNSIIESNKKILCEIKKKYLDYEIVSLHLRRGDLVEGMKMYDKLWFEYFEKAKEIFKNKRVKYMVFTGGNHNNNNAGDYAWCRKNLIGDDFIFWDYEKTTMNDFTLMFLCDHNVLSPSSTLSWWVGFLNMKNKTVIAPKKYHRLVDDAKEGFYPNNFIII